jgi:uncharacterized protein (UPF0333 family)
LKINKGQISVEYLIVIGFVVFIVITLLGIAFFYTSSIKDNIKLNQVNGFANKIISNSEYVFFAGEPSKATVTAFLPGGIESFEIVPSGAGSQLVFNVSTESGSTVIAYTSTVPINVLSDITSSEGLKKIEIIAFETEVIVSQV